MENGSESILIISQYFPPETGACPTRWDELSKRWSENATVTVITSAPDYPEGKLYEGYDNEWLRWEERGDVEVIYTKTLTSPSGNLVRRSLKFVWFMLISMIAGIRYTSPTVVIATSPQPFTGVSAWVIARLNRATFIFEVRDLWPESILAVSDFDNQLVIWVLERTVISLYRRSDRLIVVSQGFIEPIVEMGIDRSNIVYHPNGIDLDFYQLNGDESSSALDNIDDQFTISYVGTIGRAHGLSVVHDAARSLEDVQFVIVGDGAERQELEALAGDLDNVTFTGRRPKKEVPSILNASDAALVHLKPRAVFETVIPSKLLESMAAGLPVILGVHGEAERILREAGAGLVMEPGDSDDLVHAVNRLRDDPEERGEFANAGRNYVVEHFDWDTIAREYLKTVTESQLPVK